MTALKVVGVELQRLEKVNSSEVPDTATVAMSRVVESTVWPTAKSVGDAHVVCQVGAVVGGADVAEALEIVPSTALNAKRVAASTGRKK